MMPPLTIGDTVYYESPTAEYTLKRGRIVEFKLKKLSDRPLIEVTDKVVMDNGDEVKASQSDRHSVMWSEQTGAESLLNRYI